MEQTFELLRPWAFACALLIGGTTLLKATYYLVMVVQNFKPERRPIAHLLGPFFVFVPSLLNDKGKKYLLNFVVYLIIAMSFVIPIANGAFQPG
jgi:hypothetical protein